MTSLHRHRIWTRLLSAALLATVAGLAFAQTQEPGCDFTHEGGGGPFDYRSQRGMLAVVERRHFTLKVERLVSGESTKDPAEDIDYTLRKFPNHHRALMSLSRLSERVGSTRVNGMQRSVNCYFERALRWWADDTVTRLIYAQHLGRAQRRPEALAHLQMALRYANDNPLTHYNIGLVALDLNDHALALQQAHVALALGYPATGLREGLVKSGHWAEPAIAAPVAASASAASAATVGGTSP